MFNQLHKTIFVIALVFPLFLLSSIHTSAQSLDLKIKVNGAFETVPLKKPIAYTELLKDGISVEISGLSGKELTEAYVTISFDPQYITAIPKTSGDTYTYTLDTTTAKVVWNMAAYGGSFKPTQDTISIGVMDFETKSTGSFQYKIVGYGFKDGAGNVIDAKVTNLINYKISDRYDLFSPTGVYLGDPQPTGVATVSPTRPPSSGGSVNTPILTELPRTALLDTNISIILGLMAIVCGITCYVAFNHLYFEHIKPQ